MYRLSVFDYLIRYKCMINSKVYLKDDFSGRLKSINIYDYDQTFINESNLMNRSDSYR